MARKAKIKHARQESRQDVGSLLNELFVLLDNAELAPATVMKSAEHKEHYETLAMFAFRKLAAARYHTERVNLLLAEHNSATMRTLAAKKLRRPPSIVSARMSFSRTANEFIYELSAFFAATRSAIDFLAQLCGQHSKSIQVNSVSTFLKFVAEGRSGPTVDVVGKHVVWLIHLRDYRDYLVHRLTIGATSGGQREWKGGKWAKVVYPVVVPIETLVNVPDTRMSRSMETGLSNVSVTTMEMCVTNSDGELIRDDRIVKLIPMPGFERIEVLMKRELHEFEGFFRDVIKTLIGLEFGPVAIDTKKAAVQHTPGGQ